MNSIINFYKNLDITYLIIFWGIVIVILLTIILIITTIYKKKKRTKKINNKEYENTFEEELPIKKEEINVNKSIQNEIHTNETIFIPTPQQIFNEATIKEELNKESLVNVTNNEQEKEINPIETKAETSNEKVPIEMPTGPYQRNVLREMSLSQTSPIGINRRDVTLETTKVMAKDLSNSLNYEKNDITEENQINKAGTINNHKKIENELPNIKEEEKKQDNIEKTIQNVKEQIDIFPKKEELPTQEIYKNNNDIHTIDKKIYKTSLPKELLELSSDIQREKQSNEKYLEEVNKKLSEVEEINDIERTSYELQQEEEAIISYKELMEKKDSIKTIDEEEAVISIEELMNRANNNQEEVVKEKKEEQKLYNINELEENDNFIQELKKFRDDL